MTAATTPTGNRPFHRPGFRPLLLASAALGLSLCGRNCPNDEPPTYRTVGLRTTLPDGAPVPGAAASYCAIVPKLPGSRIEAALGVAGQVMLTVRLTNEQVTLDFAGTIEPTSSTFNLEDLAPSHPVLLPVTADDGARFDVRLASGCEPPE